MTDEHAAAKADRQAHVEAVIQSQAHRKLVVAGPGTGKTFLFKSMLKEGKNSLTLTFVNALVEDLSLELFGLSEVKTLHGFARGQLASITGESVEIYPKLSRVISEDAAILLGDEIDFDNLFSKKHELDDRLRFYKNRRSYYGYFGFADIVYSIVALFEKHQERIPRYEQVVVDEFQDFNALEVALIDLLATRSPILLAGDDDQALYETLRGASAKYIRDRFSEDDDEYSSFGLPYCSRSTAVIVNAANDIIREAQRTGLLAERVPKEFRYFPCAEKDSTSQANPMVVHALLFSKQIPWFIEKEIKEIALSTRGKFDVLVLSPTRNQCREIAGSMAAKGFKGVRCPDHSDALASGLMDGLLLLLSDLNSNLGWRIAAKAVLAEDDFGQVLRRSESVSDGDRFLDLLSGAIRKEVRALVATLRKIREGKAVEEERMVEVLKAIGFDPLEHAAELLRGVMRDSRDGFAHPAVRGIPILSTTFQSAKGLSADYVFISHCDDRFCVRDKAVGVSDQDVCSFLVALTRAKSKVYLLSTDRGAEPTLVSWIDDGHIRVIKGPGID